MQIGNSFRIYPDTQQSKILLNWIGCQRFIYNSKVSEDRYFKSFNRKFLVDSLIDRGFDQSYSQFKSATLTPWLYDVPSVILRNGAVLWKQAYTRFYKKLAGRPTIKSKHGKQSVWLTNELFEFTEIKDGLGNSLGYDLNIGNKKFPVGSIKVKFHNEFKIPKTIHISVIAGKWFVSFNYDNDLIEPSDKDNLAQIKKYSIEELEKVTCGIDRGITIKLSTSKKDYNFSKEQDKSILKSLKYKSKWQRKMAKRLVKGQKPSNNYLKAKNKAARYSLKITNIRKDFAHKTSFDLVNSDFQLFVLEDLKLKNMTKSSRGTIEKPGKNVAQKSSLNRELLNSGLGQVAVFLDYKARRKGKYVIKVNPKNSSQECSCCSHIHKDNRKTQSRFICLSCGYQDNADSNANKVLKKRGIDLVLSKDYLGKKESIKVGSLSKKIGQDLSESVIKSSKLVEIVLDTNDYMNQEVLLSVKQETPTRISVGI